MAFNVSALANYTEQNNFPLLRRSLFTAKTAKIAQKQVGIKSASTLNYLDTNATFQADGCGFNANGTTTFTQRTLTVGKMKVQQDFCFKDLESKYLQTQLPNGSYDETMPFEEIFTGLLADEVAAQLETAAWQGDTNSGTNNLSYFDGFIKIISGCTGYVTGNTTAITAITQANVIAIVDSIYAAIPENVIDKSDMRIFAGFDVYRAYTIALKNQNLYNYAVESSDFELVIPGTSVKLVALHGLDGTNVLVAARESNLYIGVDLESDSENFKLWWSEDFQAERFSVNFKYGTQVAFCADIVFWHL